MRLPLAIPLDSRDGLTDQDGQLVNMVVENYEGLSFVEPRPGLSQLVSVSGSAGGVVCFGGELVSLFGATFGFFDLESPEWGSGTTYAFQGTVWYLGGFYFSTFDNNTGNVPGGIGWRATRPTTPEWNPSESYDIGDSIELGGVVYYSYKTATVGESPASNPGIWDTVAPGSARYSGASNMGGGPVYSSGVCASKMAVAESVFNQAPNKSCPGPDSSSHAWFEKPISISGSIASCKLRVINPFQACASASSGNYDFVAINTL